MRTHQTDESLLSRIIKPKVEGDVLCNQRIKLYPDPGGGWYIAQTVTYDAPRFRPDSGWEMHKPEKGAYQGVRDEDPEDDTKESGTGSKRAFNRARARAFDLLMSNPDVFNVFVTFTVDPKQADRSDYDAIVEKLSVWLSNRVQRNGLRYILVPEYHKDGVNIHFHGIANRSGLRLRDSGHRSHGSRVYNVEDLPLGFSTAIPITGEKSEEKISKYVWKYMTKQGGQRIGGRYFLHGGELREPRYIYRNVKYEDAPGALISPCDGLTCKVCGLTGERIFMDPDAHIPEASELTVSGMSNAL